MSAPGAATRLFAVLGDPVAHSRSPHFQNAAIRAAGIDAVYLALRCGADDLPGMLRAIARAGGGGNVTVPHKALAAQAVERRTPLVEQTGACNTFWLHDGQVWGDNTDVAGVRGAVEALLGPSGIAPRRVLLLGAGGAASAALAALGGMGVEQVAVVNRGLERARLLCERYAAPALALAPLPSVEELGDAEWDLVVNATSLGLAGELPPVGAARFRAALDLVYAPGGTPWVRSLRAAGVPAADGTEMLLRQGAAAFERWFGCAPDLHAMRAALAP